MWLRLIQKGLIKVGKRELVPNPFSRVVPIFCNLQCKICKAQNYLVTYLATQTQSNTIVKFLS